MNVEKELNAMQERMFGGGLTDRVFASVMRELEDPAGDDVSEREYREGKAALAKLLDSRQAAALAELERLFMETLRAGLRLSFFQGLAAGFRDEAAGDAFWTRVAEQIDQMPHMAEHPEYFGPHQRARKIEDALCEALSEADAEHVTSVTLGWDERVYSALRHGFFLGFCLALTTAPREDVSLEAAVREAERQVRFAPGWFTLGED